MIDRLGLGYEELRKIKPDLVMISMSGYGRGGPESGYVSYGPAQVPLSGMSQLTGYAGWQPMHVGMSYGDPNAGLHAAFAVLSALFYRERTGKGQYIDMSQQEATIGVLGEAFMEYGMNGAAPPRNGNRIANMAPHGVFMAAGEDRWLSIACATDDEWRALCDVMERPDLADDPRFRTLADRKANEDDLETEIMSWTLTQDPLEATERLQAAGIAACAAADEQASSPKTRTSPPATSSSRKSIPRSASACTPAFPGACPTRRARSGARPRHGPGQRLRLRRSAGDVSRSDRGPKGAAGHSLTHSQARSFTSAPAYEPSCARNALASAVRSSSHRATPYT